MYPKKFIDESFIKPVNIYQDSVEFIALQKLDVIYLKELVKLYMSIYNSDNKRLIEKYKFKGQTTDDGIWDEEAWDIKSTTELLRSFIDDENTISAVALGKDLNSKTRVIGASAYKLSTTEDFKNRNYINPFPDVNINKIPLFYVLETFKRKINDENEKPIRCFSIKMKKHIQEEICEKYKEALIFSSTNNKHMYNIFKKEGRTTAVNRTGMGGKYQGYLHLKCEK